MSHLSDAASALCSALGRCFAAYGADRRVLTDLRSPMDDARARRRGGVVIRRLSADGRTGFAIARFAATHPF
nr:MAG TPA: hypothetical protein [Caudoviricetes sp.]